MKKRKIVFASLIAVAVGILLIGCAGSDVTAIAPTRSTPQSQQEQTDDLNSSVNDLLDKLDLDGMNGLLGALGSDALDVFGFDDIKARVRAVASGEYGQDFNSVLTYAAAVVGANVLEFLPMLISCVAIVLAYNILNAVKSRAASASVERAVYFATSALAVTVAVGYFSAVLTAAVKFVASVKTQIGAVAPVLLTLMTAAGATGSASVYTPTVALLGGGMTGAVTYFAFPALLMAIVFDIVGSVSSAVKLDRAAEFFRSACKWFLGTAFFLFVAVIGVSGITASVRDGISVRAARFALSKYIPVIGGYLSQGFDFVMAGNVLIKNAVGSSAVVLLVLGSLPVLIKIAAFTLTLKLAAALCEPIGGEQTSAMLGAISKSSSVVAAVVAAMTFLYMLFLYMTVCTGNIGL